MIPPPPTVTVTWIQISPDRHDLCKATVAVSGFAPGTYDVRALGPGGSNSIEGSIVVGTDGTGSTGIPTNGAFGAGHTYVIEVNGIQSGASTVTC